MSCTSPSQRALQLTARTRTWGSAAEVGFLVWGSDGAVGQEQVGAVSVVEGEELRSVADSVSFSGDAGEKETFEEMARNSKRQRKRTEKNSCTSQH